jgi:predicted porin
MNSTKTNNNNVGEIMKNNKSFTTRSLFKVSVLTIAVGMASHASAGIELYNQDGTTFSADGLLNTFYVHSKVDNDDNSLDRTQSRVKMGFLPNYIGFNTSKQMGDLKLGARSSFWVSINDANSNLVDSTIDVRQFYGTIDGDWGQVLIGKDFALFNRSNIMNDEILLGYGQTHTTTVDGNNVSFGNIGTGYLYPFPNSQITYRTPDMSGMQLAVGLMDPAKSGAGSEESTPRIEAELTYNFNASENVPVKLWVGGMSQSSDNGSDDIDSNGVSYGANVKFGGLSLTASGFQADGVGAAGLGNLVTTDKGDVDGYLVQGSYSFGSERLVLSYGENKGGTTDGGNELDLENTSVAWFHSVNSNLTLVAEYDMTESATQDTDTIALGAVLTW